MERHALSITAENHPGVLTQVCGLFATREANIQYLAAGPTDQRNLSHMTVVVRAAGHLDVEDLVAHAEKVPHVTAVEVLQDVETVVDELQAMDERTPRTVSALSRHAF